MSHVGDGKNSDRSPWRERGQDSTPWGFLLFGLIGATATTIAAHRLRRTVAWVYDQLKSQAYSSWTNTTSSSSHGSHREDSWRRFNRRLHDEYEDEMERVERIRRMQSVFNRERSKHKKTYESWTDHGPSAYQYYPRDDWYWKTDSYYKEQRTNFKPNLRDAGNYTMSHHYSILGLDRARSTPYTDAEIKTAFRAKALEFHPDQNQDNKKAAEARFKEVMTSYEAIKQERKNGKCC